jgi:phosphohistidine phosphatase
MTSGRPGTAPCKGNTAMRTLTLIRHAKSSWKDSTLTDFDRPLNKRGEKTAPMMGRLLHDMGVSFELIVSSPAARALATARLIAGQLGYPVNTLVEDAGLYEATTDRLLNVVHQLPDRKVDVALVGHNPGLTDFCNYLCGEGIENLPTCAVASIRFDTDTWKAVYRDTGRLIRYEYPRKHAD